MRRRSVVGAPCFLFLPAIAGGLNDKTWIPILPQRLDSMDRSGEPDWMNEASLLSHITLRDEATLSRHRDLRQVIDLL